MTGTVTIKDGSTVKYVFNNPTGVKHLLEVVLTKTDAPGSESPAVDHEKTVYHVIQVDFDLMNLGPYSAGQNPGLTGSIWKQQAFLLALKSQAASTMYTLIEDDDVENTSGYSGVVYKIDINRLDTVKNKKTGTLLFLKTTDVFNL